MSRIKEIEVSIGITVENKGVYYKPNARVVFEVDVDDTEEAQSRLWKKAWEVATHQVGEQIKSLG
jgi:hypothetical protein